MNSTEQVGHSQGNNSTAGVNHAAFVADALLKGCQQVIKGKTDTIAFVVTALLADGHVLLEDYPGSGKTTLTKALGKLIDAGPEDSHIKTFRRIQFTPDMLPGDVLGVTIFEPKTGSFNFVHGPVFAHVLLADELNRTSPKVQAAFLECMAEKQVTIDAVTHPLDDLFFVVGTQNPLDLAGTYPLPLVQLDRFLLKIPMSYVDPQTELAILSGIDDINKNLASLQPVCTRDDVLKARQLVGQVHVAPVVREAIVNIVQATRNNPDLHFGASTRAALMYQKACQAWALVHGRNSVTEDDLKALLIPALAHRLKFHASAGTPTEALQGLAAPHIEKLVRAGA